MTLRVRTRRITVLTSPRKHFELMAYDERGLRQTLWSVRVREVLSARTQGVLNDMLLVTISHTWKPTEGSEGCWTKKECKLQKPTVSVAVL